MLLTVIAALIVLSGFTYMGYWFGFREGLRVTIQIVEEERAAEDA